jgi:hypothetical protein
MRGCAVARKEPNQGLTGRGYAKKQVRDIDARLNGIASAFACANDLRQPGRTQLQLNICRVLFGAQARAALGGARSTRLQKSGIARAALGRSPRDARVAPRLEFLRFSSSPIALFNFIAAFGDRTFFDLSAWPRRDGAAGASA